MNERTHSWIAVRAIALLAENEPAGTLAAFLKPHARKASVGAWIPDQTDSKRSGVGNSTDCHILKMKPHTGGDKKRFVVKKDELLKRLGAHRQTAAFLAADTTLDGAWWDGAYKGDVSRPGQHLPNRVMALSTMLKDLLLMGDATLDRLIPGEILFADYLDPELRTRELAAATYFFMLSHFVADSSMPCHCDDRKLAGYSEGLHKELEEYWSKKIGTAFDKKNLVNGQDDGTTILDQARAVDAKFGLKFAPGPIPGLYKDHDEWLEGVYLCRASFAVSCILAPESKYPFGGDAQAPFALTFPARSPLLADMSRAVLHDAVLNTAIIWKRIWEKVSKE